MYCIFWAILAVVLITLEFITSGLLLIFFGVSAVFTAIVSIFTDSFIIQLSVFILLSMVSILSGRPVLSRFFAINREVKPSAVDAMSGKSGKLIKCITHDSFGLAKIEGEVWTVKSFDGTEICEGEMITVIGIEGVKALVRKADVQQILKQ